MKGSERRSRFSAAGAPSYDDLRTHQPSFLVLNYLVAKRCAVERLSERSPWANALEISIYTGVEVGTAAGVLRKLARLRPDVAYERARDRLDRKESWCILPDREGLLFLDVWRTDEERTT